MCRHVLVLFANLHRSSVAGETSLTPLKKIKILTPAYFIIHAAAELQGLPWQNLTSLPHVLAAERHHIHKLQRELHRLHTDGLDRIMHVFSVQVF